MVGNLINFPDGPCNSTYLQYDLMTYLYLSDGTEQIVGYLCTAY